MRQGVEINGRGAPVAYHIRETHPLDLAMMQLTANWQRVPARTRTGRRRVIHAYEHERVGQHRGVPLFAPILSSFRMLDRYQRTEMQTAVVNSLIAAFIETTASAEQLAQFFDLDFEQYLGARQQWQGSLEGGAILQMPPGDRVTAFTPNRSATAFDSFCTSTLRHIATGLNMPYELLVKDFSKTNYSSARAALLEAWRYFNGRRKWLATYWAQPVYELWLEEAVRRGFVEAPEFNRMRHAYTRARWIGAGRGWIDPVKEATAAKLRMEVSVSTLEDECAEQGKDWEETLEQLAREKARREELGLGPAPTATDMVAGAAALGVVDDAEDEDEETEDADAGAEAA
jgi:lambda family phage portal protein